MATASCAPAARHLKISIIGAGMGGLGTALSLAQAGFDNIHVYERAPGLGFVGAGIQLAANMARVLQRWGVWDEIKKEAVLITSNKICEGVTDAELGNLDFRPIGDKYGFPHMVGHRATLANGLYNACLQQAGITFHLDCIVSTIETFQPRPRFVITPTNDKPYAIDTDVLLASDGIKSPSRAAMLESLGLSQIHVEETGQAAYRIMLPREEMMKYPELQALIDNGCVTRWIGEKRHIIAYPIDSNQLYNISTVQPDVNFAGAATATWTTKGSKMEMLKVFGDFCLRVQRFLSLVPDGEVVEWKLQVHQPLPTWVLGSVALVGDACHPTLPHMGQGAAMAIEDAAVLGVVLSRLPDTRTDSINRALRTYEALRRDRASMLVEMAHVNGKMQHLGEGQAKKERDELWNAIRQGKKGPIPEKWADPDIQDMIYGTDVVEIAERDFEHIFAALSDPVTQFRKAGESRPLREEVTA